MCAFLVLQLQHGFRGIRRPWLPDRQNERGQDGCNTKDRSEGLCRWTQRCSQLSDRQDKLSGGKHQCLMKLSAATLDEFALGSSLCLTFSSRFLQSFIRSPRIIITEM